MIDFEAMTLGDRIRLIRLDQRLTQDDLCKRAGISKGFLSDIENGKRDMSTKRLVRIAEALNLSLDFLVRGKDRTATLTKEQRECLTHMSIYILTAHDGEEIKEVFAVKDDELAFKCFEILKAEYGGANVCLASRAVGDVPQWIQDYDKNKTAPEPGFPKDYIRSYNGMRLRHG